MSVCFVFPGQGSQSLGMQAALAAHEPTVRATYAEASAVLGTDLWQLASEGPVERLNATEWTQPLMLTAGCAAYRAWRARGGTEPARLAGHSLGEFTALVCAGALEFAAGVRLVQFRARAMQAAVPAGTGAMAAVLGLEDAEVEAACAEAAADEIVEPVNYNAPGQLVIAGHVAAVDRAMLACKARGAKRALRLPVSVPAHSSLMRPAGVRLAEELERVPLRRPERPVSAIGGEPHGDPAAIRAALVRQLSAPVRWTDTVRGLIAAGATAFVECGPGKVLTTLNRRIAGKELPTFALEDPDELAQALDASARMASA
jgi:[acyl-carrier-protein] S-malonyltransferase